MTLEEWASLKIDDKFYMLNLNKESCYDTYIVTHKIVQTIEAKNIDTEIVQSFPSWNNKYTGLTIEKLFESCSQVLENDVNFYTNALNKAKNNLKKLENAKEKLV